MGGMFNSGGEEKTGWEPLWALTPYIHCGKMGVGGDRDLRFLALPHNLTS